MKKWKYSISAAHTASKTAPILLTGSICDCLRTAASLGFDAIEYHTRENVELDYTEIHRTMNDTGCKISMIVTGRLFTEGGISLTSSDTRNEHAALQGFIRYIDIAEALHCGLVLGWAKGNVRDTSSKDAFFYRLSKNLRIIDDMAASKNVPIVIEVINHYEVDTFITARELVAYLDQQNFKNCYAHLDTYHMMLEEEYFSSAIQTAAKHIGYMHFADSTRWYPGSGYIDFKEILRALDSIGYDGYLSIECFPHDNAIETAQKGLQYLKCIEASIRRNL